MKKLSKKLIAAVLVAAMVLAFAGCKKNGGAENNVPTYTYVEPTSALGNTYNPHTWETSIEDSVMTAYLSSPFCTMQILNSEDGVYQWVYEMATSIEDVTATHKSDLTKYGCTLVDGKTVDTTNEGFVFEIKLNKDAKWQDGTPINADSYIYSMKQLLNPEMKNYRANLYYSGESAVAGGLEYYNQGSLVKVENINGSVFTNDDLVLGEDGKYYTADNCLVYFAVGAPLAGHLQGDALKDYVDAYGDKYFGTESFLKLADKMDAEGYVVADEETLPLMIDTITAKPEWDETPADAAAYMCYEKEFKAFSFENVGLYKTDDYTLYYVTQTSQDINYFRVSCGSMWLVYEPFYEAGKDTTGSLVTTDYCTKVENTMSYGPYKLVSLQTDKQMVLEKNENWYGYKKEDGRLVSTTPYLVDGKHVNRYQTDKVVINVMDDAAAKQAFLKGEIDIWEPTSDDLITYAASDSLYKVDETYTQSFFFNTNVDTLKKMDESKGNKNSVVLSNVNFRKAFSLCVDRSEWVTSTPGYKPAYSIMNNLYFYDVYNDPTSSYRGSDEAMQAICNLYGVKYGEGTPYATLKDAYKSINGYNLTEAKLLMKQACEELVAEGLYNAGEDIKIRVGYKKGALDSADNKQVELFNKYLNAAAEGSGFGKFTLEAVGNLTNRYDDVPKGEFAIGYGAWGGAAFYPFRNFQVYCNSDQYSLNEAGCWDPANEALTINVDGEDVTMTWKEWSGSLIGSGKFTNADFKTKLYVTAQMEEKFLEKYYRIPFAGSTSCTMLSQKLSYYTDDYNIMYGFGGLELFKYNYSDQEWADYISKNQLKYE